MLTDLENKPSKKVQVAIDFLSSYGIAILIIIVAIAIAYKVSTGTTNIFSLQCTASEGFSCGYYSLADNGLLNFGMAQGTGSAITVDGIACSTQISANGLPLYGNHNVARSAIYYPFNVFSSGGISMPSGSQKDFQLYCYGPNGIATSQTPGSPFVGYVWLNYTIQNTNIHTTQQIAAVGTESVI